MDYTDDPKSAADRIGGTRTPIGWDIPSDFDDYDLWVEAGIELTKAFDIHQWQFADWWNSGLWERGARKALVDDPRWRGKTFEACMNTASVGKAFIATRRHEALTFTHHEAVRSLPEDKQDELLDWCEAKDGQPRKSVREVRKEVAILTGKKKKDDDDAPPPEDDKGVQDWIKEMSALVLERDSVMNTHSALCERDDKFKVAAMFGLWEAIKEERKRDQQHAERGNGSYFKVATSSRRRTTPRRKTSLTN